MVAYNSKKRITKKSKGGNIKPITEMIEKQQSNAESFFEAMDKNKNEKEIGEMNTNIKEMVEQDNKELALQEQEVNTTKDIEMEESNEQVNILNGYIKKAISINKGFGKRGLTSKQYNAILKGYFAELNVEMSEEQTTYIRTITDVQAMAILKVIDARRRWRRNKLIQQEIAERKQLASNQ